MTALAAVAQTPPGDIKTTSLQQFVNYSIGPHSAIDDVEDFKYSVKVSTNKYVENAFYHLAQWFESSSAYYSGIQPHSDGTVGFRFSSFVPGSVAYESSPDCSRGADGAPRDLRNRQAPLYAGRRLHDRDRAHHPQ